MQPQNWRECRCRRCNFRAPKHIQNKGFKGRARKGANGVEAQLRLIILQEADQSGGVMLLPLQVLRSGCRVKPTGQLQRTPVTESWHVLSQPPLFTAHVSAGKQALTVRQTLCKYAPQMPSWPISLFLQKRHTCTPVLHHKGGENDAL